jgi:hypothetical protein
MWIARAKMGSVNWGLRFGIVSILASITTILGTGLSWDMLSL